MKRNYLKAPLMGSLFALMIFGGGGGGGGGGGLR